MNSEIMHVEAKTILIQQYGTLFSNDPSYKSSILQQMFI